MDNKKSNKEHHKFPPSNVSVHYYTDPIYSTDAFYGYAEDDSSEKSDAMENKAEDEPVESWGWINNTDY